MSEILNELPIKGDMPGVTQTDVINQSHPGYIGPMPEYRIEDEMKMGYPPDMFSGPLLKGGKILSRFKDAISNLYKNPMRGVADWLAQAGAMGPTSKGMAIQNALRKERLAVDPGLRRKLILEGLKKSRFIPKKELPSTNPAWVLDDLGLPKTEYGNLGGILGQVVNPTGARIGRQVHPGDMGSRGLDILDEAYTRGRMVRGGTSKPIVAPGKGVAPAKNVMPPSKGVGETMTDFIKRDVSKTLGKKNLERLNKSVQYELGDIQRGWLDNSTYEIQMLVNKYGTKLKPGTKGYLKIEEALYKKHGMQLLRDY